MARDFSILVVASDEALRRSLRFMLEAEGFRMLVHGHVPMPGDSALEFDCVVIDEASLRHAEAPLADLLDRNQPVILLVNHLPGIPALVPMRLVEKPMLGSMLIEAIHHALTLTPAASPLAT